VFASLYAALDALLPKAFKLPPGFVCIIWLMCLIPRCSLFRIHAAKVMGVGSSGGLWRVAPTPAPCNGVCGTGEAGAPWRAVQQHGIAGCEGARSALWSASAFLLRLSSGALHPTCRHRRLLSVPVRQCGVLFGYLGPMGGPDWVAWNQGEGRGSDLYEERNGIYKEQNGS